MVVHPCQSLAMPGDVVDEQDFRNGFVEAVALEAIAVVEEYMHQSVSKLQAVGWDE